VCPQLVPLIGAIAAGNAVAVKPSEVALATEKAVRELLPQYVDNSCISCVCGGIDMTTALLDLQWDKIFFTGSGRVGKIVMAAAAKHLTPVSLELGGKSPAYIDETVTDLKLVCNRLLVGKMMNAGQTCVAPDYVLCHMDKYEAFLEQCARTLEGFYGADPAASADFCRIITPGHCERLKGMLENVTDNNNRRLICGGQVDVAKKYVAPTVFADVSLDDCLMKEEIFGPILPVIPVSSTEEAIKIMRKFERPLALYVFSKSNSNIDNVFGSIQSGAAMTNDAVVHLVSSETPFGGIGPSGLGNYRGKFSYDAFSHHRTVLKRDDHGFLDPPFRYPPYSAKNLSMVRAAAGLPNLPSGTRLFAMTWKAAFVIGVAAAGFYIGHRFGDRFLQ
jgi:acyl-CoA reductase-like NAD-dependent aldehyde dehydrogenase